MNSKSGSVPRTDFEFDFDLGGIVRCTRSLNAQKQQSSPYSSPSSQSSYSKSSSSWVPNKPSWTHQPAHNHAPLSQIAPALSNPTSMVGDIHGKSWASATPSNHGIGIVEKDPNLFGDLLGTALGQSKSNVPLKDSAPKNTFSMGKLADSIPKSTTPLKPTNNWGSTEGIGGFPTQNVNRTANFSSSTQTGGASKKDPFGSLLDFGSKPAPMSQRPNVSLNTGSDSSFGVFQGAPKSGTSSVSDPFPKASNANVSDFSTSSVPKTSSSDPFTGLFFGNSGSKPMNSSGVSTQDFSSQKPVLESIDPLDTLFPSSSSGAAAHGSATQPLSEVDDWGLDSGFGEAGDNTGATTELEGLPPPPVGVTGSMAKGKGMDNQKQGQYPDAIKWLSWAVILLEKAGDDASTMEVLTCRASCYKEVGEYKKAVADCSKILDHDGKNASVLLQRALLYESIEKYRLGAEDLRAVLKIDPGNRLAKNTLNRLAKLAD